MDKGPTLPSENDRFLSKLMDDAPDFVETETSFSEVEGEKNSKIIRVPFARASFHESTLVRKLKRVSQSVEVSLVLLIDSSSKYKNFHIKI